MTPAPHERYRPFVTVFVPFAVVFAVANLAAEAGQVPIPGLLDHNPHLTARLAGNLTFARVVYSIWLALAFAAPALVLFFRYDLRTAPPAVYRYWQLFWALGFVAYAAHAYLATGDWFDWDFTQIARRQGLAVAGLNYLLLVVWGVDVAVSVVRGQAAGGRSFYRFQWGTHLLFAAMAFVAGVLFFSVVKTYIGFFLGGTVAAAAVLPLLARLAFGPPAVTTAGTGSTACPLPGARS